MADGVSRLRGAKSGGIRTVHKFNAVSFCTREEGLADLVDYEGSLARTIGFIDYPFGAKSKELEVITSNLNSTVDANYGHAGIRWMEFLVSQMKDPGFIPSLKKSHEKYKTYFDSENSKPGALTQLRQNLILKRSKTTFFSIHKTITY